MSDLVAFLRARLDEDEAAANVWPSVRPQMTVHDLLTIEGPARVLREVEAKRAILAEYQQTTDAYVSYGLMLAVHYLAGVYRDHPDYDPSWE